MLEIKDVGYNVDHDSARAYQASSFFSPETTPITLHVCRESRQEASRHYKSFNQFSTRPIYIDLKMDTILLTTSDLELGVQIDTIDMTKLWLLHTLKNASFPVSINHLAFDRQLYHVLGDILMSDDTFLEGLKSTVKENLPVLSSVTCVLTKDTIASPTDMKISKISTFHCTCRHTDSVNDFFGLEVGHGSLLTR